ncbi:antibiotic biosynthesis monooxygenase [Mucilaginibacter sp. 14171R-50]|uniref:antibiotic biosynthesis monooxygenase family protein n=1 Tax=Mucilaginibacter sp. 14171R-50 TaxID=2703789 RepID=UPI00138CE01F|nr:antibiotic biosynthesis monooxygenase [Mucilaginibacter sp. 14171R-50]QHS54228.1 antibiotic biosynthesis monooxygenase [Mucilaginibacter sp. 14171R-50]
MVLEVAILNVIPGQEDAFLKAFYQAQSIISGMAGYLSHQLKRCTEDSSKFILLMQWEKLTDHTEGFRRSIGYQEWKKLLHHFYSPFPTVEHYEDIEGLSGKSQTSYLTSHIN